VLALKVRGQLDDLTWSETLRWLRPGSRVSLHKLPQSRNPYSAIRTPHFRDSDAAGAAARGRALFRAQCAQCHGAEGGGGTGPSLVTGEYRRGGADWALFRTLTRGIPGTVMTARELSDAAAWELVAYLRAIARGQRGGSSAPRVAPVSSPRLRAAAAEPWNWLTYSGTLDGQRHSRLDQVNRTNAQRLQLAWVYPVTTQENVFESSPLVVDGVMFLTEPPNNVVALDAATGRARWRLDRPVPDDVALCCGRVNRGLAVLGERLYLATLDAHLLAIDAATGRIDWDVPVADYRDGYSGTAAPLAVEDMVITGVAGGEFGIRGHLDAYDAATGTRRWRFWTVPAPGEPGSESWQGDSWKTGGGATWLTGSYDAVLGLVYWGVGNPAPNYQGDLRGGDNLYSNSVIAIRHDTGQLVWYFQFTPHDEHDWDANQIPVLADLPFDGNQRSLLLWANRNAFYYVLDRQSGEFLRAIPFAKQTWADHIDTHGRPTTLPEVSPSEDGRLVYPGVAGATNWWSPSYNPRSRLLYVPTMERASLFFKGEDSEFTPRELFTGSSSQGDPKDPGYVALRALNASSGDLTWEHRFPPETSNTINGVLSTAGDLVFVGHGSEFVALDAVTGTRLWGVQTGSRVWAAPITFAVGGRQMVAVASGRNLLVFTLPSEVVEPVPR